jgi:poly(3-hydroxybutyrate) depolymerase
LSRLVQLPLHPDGGRSYVAGLQADQLAPPQTGEPSRTTAHELVVTAVYVPDARPANPAIVVAMHGCGGSGPGFCSGSEFASLADRYGFIVIYPSATQQAGFGNCFDTWSDAAKRRGGG